MNHTTIRLVSAALSAVITTVGLVGIGTVADTQSAAYPEMLARAKARESSKAPVSIAIAPTTGTAR